jgi:hypothetical protein
LNLKTALIVISAVLIVSLAANGSMCSLYAERDSLALNLEQQKQTNANLQGQVAGLENQIIELQNQTQHLSAQAGSLRQKNLGLQNQNTVLQREVENLTASAANIPLNKPRLVTRLGASNVIESAHGSEPRLFVEGDVFNTGGAMAWNASLHVTLYVQDKIVADVSLPLGDMEPFSGVHVSTNIEYNQAVLLTKWAIIPETNP